MCPFNTGQAQLAICSTFAFTGGNQRASFCSRHWCDEPLGCAGRCLKKKDGVLWNSAAHYPARSHFHHPLLSPPPDHFQKMKQKQKLRSRYLHFNQETQSFANLNEKQSLGSRVPKLQSHFIKELTWSMAVWKINYPRTPTLTTEPWSGDKISFLKMKNYF